MSRQSEAVKKWRKEMKCRTVLAMGGSCVICGYRKCPESMDLHHLDPSQKDFTIGHVRANPKSWPKIVAELKKCVLLCRNCHGEIHAGVSVVSPDARRFDEKYSILPKKANPDSLLDTCPICLGPKPIIQRSCSTVCSARSKYVIAWDSLDLASMLKNRTYQSIADELGCSDAAVRKRAIKLGLRSSFSREV